MSNNKNNREQDKVLIDTMHPNQLNPGLAKPEEFRVKTHAEAAKLDVPAHGQCGDSRAEYERLEREGSADGKSKLNSPRPQRPDVDINRNPKSRINAANAPHDQE